MRQVKFIIEDGEEVVVFALPGENLLELARKGNIAVDAPCSGNGSCGKCRVRLDSGTAKTPHSRHISGDESAEGWVLACETEIADSDISVFVPDIASAYKSRMKIADLSDPVEIERFNNVKDQIFESGIQYGTNLQTVSLTLTQPSLEDTMSDLDRVCSAVRHETGLELIPAYHTLRKLPDVLRQNEFKLSCLLRGEGNGRALLLDLWCEPERHPLCGLAVDIGTTTVSAVIADLESGRILSKASSGNGQIRYGADVINRIIEAGKPGGSEKLRKAVLDETILPLISTMCDSAGLKPEWIYKACIVSNTTMNHLLLALNPEHIRMEPYIPVFMELPNMRADNAGLPLCPEAEVVFAPNVGSYVGGDITAGTLSSMMWTKEEYSLFIDLGTNGEIVFGNNEFLVSCACSAGPAFEGGDIGCGMRATDGAIESCVIDRHTHEPCFSIIGSESQKPIGLCGSGLIDLITEMFRAGIIDSAGKIIAEGKRIRESEHGVKSYVLVFRENSGGNKDIEITEIDIDNFIRAKGAIYSAVQTMLRGLGFDIDVIENVIIAGGIGSGINIANGIRIGMLPDISHDRYRYIGNSSLTGGYAMLISREAENKVCALARNMTYMEMSSNPGYMDEFVSACFIPHTNLELFPSVKEEMAADKAERNAPVKRELPNNKEDRPLEHYKAQYRKLDPFEAAQRGGFIFNAEKNVFIINFLGNGYEVGFPEFSLNLVSKHTPADQLRQSTASQILLIRYIIEGRLLPATGSFLTYREMPWGALYNTSFTGRCIKRLAFSYGTKIGVFSELMELLGAKPIKGGDSAYELEFMDGLFIRFIIWAGEDEFPPASQILFSDNFSAAFTAEDMAVACEAVIGAMKKSDG